MIGMTGDSIGDAEALVRADVGMCMGSGCDVAKDNSDLIILDNNLESINKAINWGRATFDNTLKFIQFQLTMNISLCFITILGTLTLGQPPLNVIQMLWCNLIMDILAAVALGTEPFSGGVRKRISRKETIFTKTMWRQIFIQAFYQIAVMIFMMYFGGLMFTEKPVNIVTGPKRYSNG